MTKRWSPAAMAATCGVLAALALLGLGIALGALTGSYEAYGRAVGRVLVPAVAVAAVFGYVVQQRRTTKN